SATFAFNLASVTNGSKTFTGTNAIGELQLNSSLNAASGNLDVNNAGNLTSGGTLTTASTVAAAEALGRVTASFVTGSRTLGVVFYLVSPNSAVVLGSDASRVELGSAIAQF